MAGATVKLTVDQKVYEVREQTAKDVHSLVAPYSASAVPVPADLGAAEAIEKHQVYILELEGQFDDMKAQLEAKTTHIADLEQSLKVFQEGADKFAKERDSFQTEVEELKDKVEDLEAEVKEKADRIAEIEGQLATANERIAAQDKELEEYHIGRP